MGVRKNIADASLAKIAALENRLSGTLKPVAPRQEFLNGLNQRISQSKNRTMMVNHVANWHILAAIIAGFVSLAVLLAMVMRALLALGQKKRTA